MVKKYYYSIYGLKVEVDFKIPQLIEIDENSDVDVVVKHCIMPADIHQQINAGVRNHLTKEECWFIAKDTAIYRILNGKEIFIEEINGTFDDIKAFLLGSSFGCIFIQRNMPAIHGSTVVIGNTGIIITGKMGAGKSTLTSGFIFKGYKFAADDISAITESGNGDMIVSPAYPSQKLCRDAALKFGFDVNNLVKTDKDRDKFFVPANDAFINEKVKVKYIFEVDLKDENDKSTEIEVEEIQGFKKFENTLKNIYRSEIAVTIGINPDYFRNILNLTKNISYYKIKRPQNLFTIDSQIKEIINKVVK